MKKFLVLMMMVWAGTVSAQKLEWIESEIDLNLEAGLEQGEFRIWASLTTRQVYECSDYEIAYKLTRDEDELLIKIKGLLVTDDCLLSMGPATARVPLENLKVGEYKFKVQYKSYSPLIGTLRVTKESYKLLVEKSGMISAELNEMNLLPKNCIWGEVVFKDPDMKEHAEQFFVDMENEGCVEPDLEIGHYGMFYLHRKSGFDIRKIRGEGWGLDFVYLYHGYIERLLFLMKAYHDKFGGEMKIRLGTLEGKEYYSWTMGE